jgi:hypothetical protein
MNYLIRATTRTNETRYYTGRAGEGWMSADRRAAFIFASKTEAERKAAIFTNFAPIHGYTCSAEEVG